MAQQNQPLNFIPNVPIYNNGVMNEAWRQFFSIIWQRTGGNTNVINNITEYVLSGSNSNDYGQQIDELKKRIMLLEGDNATSLALQAIETATNTAPTINFGEVMAYSTLGIG